MTAGPRPLDALNSQVALIRALRGPDGERFASTGNLTTGGIRRDDGGRAARYIADKLNNATTVVVTDRMLSVIFERMAAVKFGEPLQAEDLLFPSGYVVFPRAIELPDLEQDDYKDVEPRRTFAAFDAGFWVPSGIADTANRTLTEDNGGILYAQAVSIPLARQYALNYVYPEYDGDDFLAGVERLARSGIRHAPIYSSGMGFGVSWDPAERESTFLLTPAGEFERRFWLSFWRTLKQEIFAPVRIARRDRRPAERLRMVPEVVVADLRRVKHRNTEERLPTGEIIMWTHRWRVTGHTRTLHRGTEQEKTVWVREHVKGPPDRPFIDKDKVYRLSR